MFKPSPGSTGKLANSFITDLVASVGNGTRFRDVLLLAETSIPKAELKSITPPQLSRLVSAKLGSGFEFVADFIMFCRFRVVLENDVGALEVLIGCVRRVAMAYIEEEWLYPVFARLLTQARKLASKLDDQTEKWRKKMVEFFRELFSSLHKERERLPGTCWLVCELLSLFMSLDQVKLCGPILAAISQSHGGFRPESVPLPVSVTLYFYWGKFHVLESKLTDAKEKLMWAFQHCPLGGNKKRIAEYLVPSMIATGVIPNERVLKECNLEHYIGICAAIKRGDVGSFNDRLEENLMTLARSGTLVLMEKCKLICYRNLVVRVVSVLKSLSSDPVKLDLAGFEAAWDMVESGSKDEMVCALADLIYVGGVKGYIALEHNKLVISKVNPFPKLEDVLA